jgi:hypothetical protein
MFFALAVYLAILSNSTRGSRKGILIHFSKIGEVGSIAGVLKSVKTGGLSVWI